MNLNVCTEGSHNKENSNKQKQKLLHQQHKRTHPGGKDTTKKERTKQEGEGERDVIIGGGWKKGRVDGGVQWREDDVLRGEVLW